ncbi:MAG: hypothetical protein R3E42_16525 [Burkholderiaceae bacterium]
MTVHLCYVCGHWASLTTANYVAFASLPWTPALIRQAEDRAYRLGQLRDVMVIRAFD